MERKAFLEQEAPEGYIAGIGRGATGFTTRSDVGSARLPPQLRTTGDDDESNFEDVNDNGVLSLKAHGDLNKDDEEAENIYREIDERLKRRNYKRKLPIDEVDKFETNLEKISSQFVDLKKNLADISEDQWASLPEAGDLTRRNKRLRKLEQEQQKTYVAPDTLLAGLNSGTETSVDLSALTSERQKLLGSKIDSAFGQNEESFDTSSYLNEISNLTQSNEEEIKRMKNILNSFTKADPKKPEGWIARARLEEHHKNFESAKKLIQQGCTNCPYDEDIWLENIRLNRYDIKYSKIIVAEAVRLNSKSLKLWLKATDLEQESFNKKRLIRKALESIPTNPELWLKGIELEDDEDDKIKIAFKATEIIPNNEKLWLTLINLQPYEDAKKTLNKARKLLEHNVQIWLAACKLEAVKDPKSDKIAKLISKTFKDCEQTREEWFNHAIKFSKQKLVILSDLIILNLYASEEKDFTLWLSDANKYQEDIHVYKAVLNLIVQNFPKKTPIWRRLIILYKKHFSFEELSETFEKIIATVPKNSLFWLMYSKEVWKNGNISEAKGILTRAFKILESNVDIWLALIKLEAVEQNYNEVEKLFITAKEQIQNARIWYKYVTFLREQNELEKSLNEAKEGINRFPDCDKLYIQKSQILQDLNRYEEAREILSIGTKQISNSVILWVLLSEIDNLKLKNAIRARSDLDLGILKNPNSDRLWNEKLKLEKALNNTSQISAILTKALKEFPDSSLLWSFNLKFNNKKSLRKTLYQDALSATKNHPRILLIIGYNFWADGKLDKSKRWFERAIEGDEDFGDSWAFYYNFLIKNNEPQEKIDEFLKRFIEAEPSHGDIWPKIAKNVENLKKPPTEILKLVGAELLR